MKLAVLPLQLGMVTKLVTEENSNRLLHIEADVSGLEMDPWNALVDLTSSVLEFQEKQRNFCSVAHVRATQDLVRSYNACVPAMLQLNTRFGYRLKEVKSYLQDTMVIILEATAAVYEDENYSEMAYEVQLKISNVRTIYHITTISTPISFP